MAAKRALRAVPAGESAPPKSVKTVAQAAAGGSHRELLVAMRERIARAVSDPDCPPRDLAALTRRLQDIAKEIDALDLRAKQESDDENADSGADETWNTEAL